ncbi:MAG: hypothetical protein KDK70_17090 [Myxococcales bacterium]|nr:hypothetical protein [Myxococcales bacterium]
MLMLRFTSISFILLLVGAPACVTTSDVCGETNCGCWEDATIDYQATVRDVGRDAPVQGAEVFCDDEDEPIAVSDAQGQVSFTLETEHSLGCGYARCERLRFSAPDQGLDDFETTTDLSNGLRVEMQPSG